MNEACNQTWTIREGSIGTLYLTCPFCNKGRGVFLRQIKAENMHEDIEKLALKNSTENDSAVIDVTDTKAEGAEEKPKQKAAKRGSKKKEESNEPENEVKVNDKEVSAANVEEEVPVKKERKKHSKTEVNVKVNVSEPEQLEIEEDIFERIKKKRQQEEEFLKDAENEDVDVLEISGDTMEEIDNRVKEFEEYYYIKVLDKSVQQQGKRYNCIIKYCRR